MAKTEPIPAVMMKAEQDEAVQEQDVKVLEYEDQICGHTVTDDMVKDFRGFTLEGDPEHKHGYIITGNFLDEQGKRVRIVQKLSYSEDPPQQVKNHLCADKAGRVREMPMTCPNCGQRLPFSEMLITIGCKNSGCEGVMFGNVSTRGRCLLNEG